MDRVDVILSREVKYKMRRLQKVGLIVVTLLVASFSWLSLSCARAPAPQTGAPGPQTTSQQAPAQVIRAIFAHEWPPGIWITPHGEKFAKLVEERTGGRVKIDYYPGGTLIGAQQLIEGLAAGSINGFGTMTAGWHAKFNKAMMINQLPYAFQTADDLRNFNRGELAQKVGKTLEANNLKVLAWHGTAVVMFSTKPLRTPEDYRGIRVRTSGQPPEEAVFKAMGASIVVIPSAEVMMAASQGLIDAVTTGTSAWAGLKWVEVLKYGQEGVTPWQPFSFETNKTWFDGLPADIQKIIQEVATEVWAHEAVEYVIQQKEADLAKGIAAGGTWIKYTPAESAKFREAGLAVWPQFEDQIGKDLVDRIRQKKW